MEIVTLIVLYNPTIDMVYSWKKCSSFSKRVIFVDNSPKPDSKIEEIINKEIENNDYISFKENKGIAYAQRYGMKAASKYNPDYVLTMDQDSEFPEEKIEEIKKILTSHREEYAIIGLNFRDEGTNSKEIENVRWWLSSGNFICYNSYRDVFLNSNDNLFDETLLFIDGVDAYMGYLFHKEKKKVAYIKGISIKHHMGNPKALKFFGKTITCLNYSPLRYYYIFRNNYYLYHSINKKFFKEDYKNVKYKMFWKIIFFEKNKWKKLKAIKKGKKDAKNKVLGSCPHEEIFK